MILSSKKYQHYNINDIQKNLIDKKFSYKSWFEESTNKISLSYIVDRYSNFPETIFFFSEKRQHIFITSKFILQGDYTNLKNVNTEEIYNDISIVFSEHGRIFLKEYTNKKAFNRSFLEHRLVQLKNGADLGTVNTVFIPYHDNEQNGLMFYYNSEHERAKNILRETPYLHLLD